MYKIIKNDDAAIGIDLIVALVLVITAVITAILIMPALSHDNISQEDKSDRIMRYMLATRAGDSLVQDDGGNWTANWTAGDYSNVTKIGFADDNSILKVLNETKIKELMGQGYPDNGTGTDLYWWEFPNSTIWQEESEREKREKREKRENATRALGLSGYNFYMQLHPVGDNSQFNLTPLLTNRSNVPINNDIASAVERYVYIRDNSSVTGFISYRNATGTNLSVHYRLNLWVW